MMSTVKLHAGVELHNMSPDEFRGVVREENVLMRASLRAIKEGCKIPKSYQGVPSGNALTLGETFQLSPAEGQVWSIRRLVVNGLAGGATPDTMALFFDDAFNQAQWYFQGITAAAFKFGRGEMTMGSGDVIFLRNVGNLTATGSIQLAGQYDILPAEQAGRLAVGS